MKRISDSLSDSAGNFKLLPFMDPGATGLNRTLWKGLILAQNERWRHGLGMQVERMP